MPSWNRVSTTQNGFPLGNGGGLDATSLPPDPFSEDPIGDDDHQVGRGLALPAVIGVLAVVAGLAGVWLWSQPSDDELEATEPAGASTSEPTVVDEVPVDPGRSEEVSAPVEDPGPSQEAETYTEPTLLFPAADGPLEIFSTYEVELAAAPQDALLQIVVDGLLQGEPAPELPNLIFPEGRHSIEVSILEQGVETARSNAIEIYVLGAEPEPGYTANLSSVSIADEGWDEALRRYDSFREAGHDSLIILPLVAGYWNLLVPGFGADAEAVEQYCGSKGLSFPDECFARSYEAGAYTAPVDPNQVDGG